MPVTSARWLILLSVLSVKLAAQAVAPAPPISAEQALAAYDRFRLAPEKSLQEAPTFLRYM